MNRENQIQPPIRKERRKKLALKYLGKVLVVLIVLTLFIAIAQQIVPNFNKEFKKKFIEAPYSKYYIVPVKVPSVGTVQLDVCVTSSTLYDDDMALNKFKNKATATISLDSEVPIKIMGNCSENDVELTYFNID